MKTASPRAAELIGARLRVLREKGGVTQVALAERSGVRQSHISAIETGAMLPSLITIMRVAAALPCKVSDLTAALDKEDLASLLPK
jgi:transcriptional regulator with XRE-family HTH domain